MILVIILFFSLAISALIALVIRSVNRNAEKPSSYLRYTLLGVFANFAASSLLSLLFLYIPGWIIWGGNIWLELITVSCCMLLMIIVSLCTAHYWFGTQDSLTIEAFQDPFLGGFASWKPGMVGRAPWLTRKEGWIMKTTAEVEVNANDIQLECKNGVILSGNIQAICGVNEDDPMRFLSLDDDPSQREVKASVALRQEVGRIANETSMLWDDETLLKNGEIIKEAVRKHLCTDSGCKKLLRRMGLVFDRVTLSGLDRDKESAEAARSRHIGKTVRDIARDLKDKFPKFSDEEAINRAMAIADQGTDVQVLSIEGLSDPRTAGAVMAAMHGAGNLGMQVGQKGPTGNNKKQNPNQNNNNPRRKGRGKGGK